MMGCRMQTTAMFQYFCLDDWVPADHLLREVDRHIDFRMFRDQLRPLYSEIGRPSIDPEVLLRVLLIGYLYGITSERHLLDEIGLNLAYRWFTGLGFDQSIPDHSTFSKNRHGRFRESTMFRDFFESVIQKCIDGGLVQGERLSVDGTVIAANASDKSRIARRQIPEAAQVSRTLREYLADVEAANPVRSEGSKTTDGDAAISSSDPDATWATKGGVPVQFCYYDNYLIDNESNVIIDVEATPARFSQEAAAARTMIERSTSRFAIVPQSLGADKAYGSGEFLAWLLDRDIAPHIRVIDRTRQDPEHFGRQDFVFDSDINAFRCPAGKLLKYRGIGRASRVYTYIASPKDCAVCPLKSQCTTGRARRLVVNFDEASRQRTQQLSGTEAYWRSCRERKKVEVLFAELKNVIKLRRFRLRRRRHVSEQALMAATAQNIRRLVRFISPTRAVSAA
jgi:transposase